MLFRTISLLLLLLISGFLNAQNNTGQDIQTDRFIQRVKNIEFFIQRFNHEEDPSVKRPDVSDSLAYKVYKFQRVFFLSGLFPIEKIKTGAPLNETGREFSSDVANNGHFLNFYDKDWYAELSIPIKGSGTMQCVMKVSGGPNGSHVWSVVSMTLGKQTERFDSTAVVFPPHINGTDFMSVMMAFRDGGIADPGKSELLAKLKNKKLVPGNITKIRYHFLQLDGWIFTVDYVSRDSANSGWLIDELIKAGAEDKFNYRKKLHVD